jgi:type IX secretion system PorP/SprF family membrane protein
LDKLNHISSIISKCLCILLLGVAGTAFGQTDPQLSQYMFVQPVYNPAAAGIEGGFSATAAFRSQWSKIDGAPQTFFIMAHNVSRNDKYAYGGQLYRDAIGPISQYGLYGDYAYRFKVKNGHFALGVRAGLSYYKTDWSSLTAFQGGDVTTFDGTQETSITPNFGAGISYKDEKFSVGFSAPHLVNNKINKKTETFQNNHYYFNFDYRLNLGSNFAIVPAAQVKLSRKANAQLDLNLNLMFIKSIWVGAGYRSDNSANFMAQYELKKDRNTFRIGYSYDLGNGAYRSATGGAHEVVLTYVMKQKDKAPEETKK